MKKKDHQNKPIKTTDLKTQFSSLRHMHAKVWLSEALSGYFNISCQFFAAFGQASQEGVDVVLAFSVLAKYEQPTSSSLYKYNLQDIRNEHVPKSTFQPIGP